MFFANQTSHCSLQAESDASSEMSDNALHKLVSRLVEAEGDLGGDEAGKVGATYVRWVVQCSLPNKLR